MQKRGLKPKLLDYRTSADASGDTTEVVGYMSAAFVEDESKKEVLLNLARASIAKELKLPYTLPLKELVAKNPWLQDEGASFVTLTTNSENLRGCIGTISAHRKLYEDIIVNAKKAAMNDPRFTALTADEFEDINVEVSLLSEPKVLLYDSIESLKSKISVGTDGVILKKGVHQATFTTSVETATYLRNLFLSSLSKVRDGSRLPQYYA